MKTNIKKFLFIIFIGIAFQCSDEFTKESLSKDELKNEISQREDFKKFVLHSVENQIGLAKISPDVRTLTEDLSNQILSEYNQNIFNKEKIQKFETLTSWFSNEPIKAYTSLKGYLLANFTYSEDDLIELLSQSVNLEIQKMNSDNESVTGRKLSFPYIDVCGVVCAVQTEQSGLQDSPTCYARSIFYSGCYVGCALY